MTAFDSHSGWLENPTGLVNGFHVVGLGWTLLSPFVSGLAIFNWLNSVVAETVSFIIAVLKNLAVGPGRRSLLDQLLM